MLALPLILAVALAAFLVVKVYRSTFGLNPERMVILRNQGLLLTVLANYSQLFALIGDMPGFQLSAVIEWLMNVFGAFFKLEFGLKVLQKGAVRPPHHLILTNPPLHHIPRSSLLPPSELGGPVRHGQN